jgi:hypothetical protein
MTRSPLKVEMLRALGVEPVVADALDDSAVTLPSESYVVASVCSRWPLELVRTDFGRLSCLGKKGLDADGGVQSFVDLGRICAFAAVQIVFPAIPDEEQVVATLTVEVGVNGR